MTVRQIFKALLTELGKVKAPSMLLEDFNYFVNRSIQQYINKRYNIYDVNQQTTDDLRVLKSTAILTPIESIGTTYKDTPANKALYDATYEVELPQDYLHCLNCICIYKISQNSGCYKKEDYISYPAKRLTSDIWSQVMNNYYTRPLPERPYYYIHNVNTSTTLPTNPYNQTTGNGTDMGSVIYKVTEQDGASEDSINLPRTIRIGDANQSLVYRNIANRYGNASKVRMEIRCGNKKTLDLVEVHIDYIKTPQFVRLTPEQMDLKEDTSQIMEFPDYVCQEIINELVSIVLESSSDPRLQTHIPVSQSIASPAQPGQNNK